MKKITSLRPSLLSLSFISLIGFSSGLHAQSIEADHDTMVYGGHAGDPDTAFPDQTLLAPRNDAGSSPKTKDQHAYISFNTSSFSEMTFSGARLDFVFTSAVFDEAHSNSWTYDVFGILDGGADEFFDESLLTFNNATHTGTDFTDSLDTESSDLLYLGEFNSDSFNGTPTTISFASSQLDTYLNNDGNERATFIILATYGSGTTSPSQFASSEHETLNGPMLTVPEPSAFAFVFGSVVLAGAMMRRRGRK